MSGCWSQHCSCAPLQKGARPLYFKEVLGLKTQSLEFQMHKWVPAPRTWKTVVLRHQHWRQRLYYPADKEAPPPFSALAGISSPAAAVAKPIAAAAAANGVSATSQVWLGSGWPPCGCQSVTALSSEQFLLRVTLVAAAELD